ncbi:uncharacterized protein LOC110418608 [Herrania umbratica]|uniref:Uncharacterized protein LOC110418608 n=1 Tax=Herrania umbratica TaxID=108875 RepID=A0A6J1AKG4_9ROSI|nr:uncharacterized protein LOC110418608 [Herrania umbratica]
MKLVGLKTEEMAEEGRFTTIIVDADFSPGFRRSGLITESPVASPTASGGEWDNQIHREEESCATKATIAGKEFFKEQQTQVMQLVHLLRQIENRVNSHRDDILESLATRRGFLQKLFRKASNFISLQSQNHDTLLITRKLHQVIYDKTDAVLSSVEDGIQSLMRDLTKQMCNPMVDYVKGLKAELKFGTCARLLAVVDEMERSMRNGRIELEEARRRIKLAEEGRIKALCKLKESEEKMMRLDEYLEFLAGIEKEHIEHLVSQKFFGRKEAEENDYKLVWELQRKKRKFETPGSPMGPKELLYFESSKKPHQSTRERPAFSHRPVIGSHLQALSPQTPCLDTRIPLGLSPSSAIQHVVSRKRISPFPLNS